MSYWSNLLPEIDTAAFNWIARSFTTPLVEGTDPLLPGDSQRILAILSTNALSWYMQTAPIITSIPGMRVSSPQHFLFSYADYGPLVCAEWHATGIAPGSPIYVVELFVNNPAILRKLNSNENFSKPAKYSSGSKLSTTIGAKRETPRNNFIGSARAKIYDFLRKRGST